MALAIFLARDRLVRGVFARDVAAPAFDAEILVDPGLGDMGGVEMLPSGEGWYRGAEEILNRRMALLVHPGCQPALQFVDDLEAVDHGGGADLNRSTAERHIFGRIAPGGDAADAGERQILRCRVARNLAHHIESDRLYGRAAIAAMSSVAIDR